MKTLTLGEFSREAGIPKTTVYRKCQELGIETSSGLSPEAIARLRQAFDLASKVKVDAGETSAVLAVPELPEAYSLELFRGDSQAVSFADPLAVAAQFLQVADGLTDAMQQDIAARQQRLQQTKSAKAAIAAKAQELQLESRLYQMQVQMLDASLTADTQELQSSIKKLNSLGKPQAAESPE